MFCAFKNVMYIGTGESYPIKEAYNIETAYLHITNISFSVSKATQDNWIVGVKIQHQFTRDILHFYPDIHSRAEALILNSSLIVLIFKFSAVKLDMRTRRKSTIHLKKTNKRTAQQRRVHN